MRHVLGAYGAEVRAGLAAAQGPEARLAAILQASFSAGNFHRAVIGAWLNFYLLALTVPAARRLLSVYQRRLRSNLVHALRPLAGAQAARIAHTTAALIDGLYLREALKPGAPDGPAAVALIEAHLACELRQARPA
jgi:TetR/AcrR family transcriptional repressor of bet genes